MKNLLLTTIIAASLAFGAPATAYADEEALSSYQDGSNVTLMGTVQNLSDDEFQLKTSDHTIDVDFGTWDWDNNTDLRNYLQNGQQVVVNGKVDKNWFTSDDIEADNMYFRQNYNYFYVVDVNPAYYAEFNDSQTMRDGSYVSMRGTVQSIDGQEFTLKSQDMNMTVDMASVSYKPKGDALSLEKGDRVFVYGEIDNNFFDGKEISADAVVKINRVSKRQSEQSQNQG